jgi:hypothetical protein
MPWTGRLSRLLNQVEVSPFCNAKKDYRHFRVQS